LSDDETEPSDQRGDPTDPSAAQPGAETEEHDDSGLDLARSIARALAGKTAKYSSRQSPARTDAARRWRTAREGRSSGAHPDDRDPQTMDTTLGRFVSEQGWETELRVHGVFSRWEAIVGRDVGQHVTPESFADGRLVVRTDSTAWATQMKMLAPDVVRRLNEVLGDGTVEVIAVEGPRGPSWKRGRLRVKGRGPRDTYG
jgi:predicted nucleic acid-binding Zn ribbon protein